MILVCNVYVSTSMSVRKGSIKWRSGIDGSQRSLAPHLPVHRGETRVRNMYDSSRRTRTYVSGALLPTFPASLRSCIPTFPVSLRPYILYVRTYVHPSTFRAVSTGAHPYDTSLNPWWYRTVLPYSYSLVLPYGIFMWPSSANICQRLPSGHTGRTLYVTYFRTEYVRYANIRRSWHMARDLTLL